jgi:hypothetical protein
MHLIENLFKYYISRTFQNKMNSLVHHIVLDAFIMKLLDLPHKDLMVFMADVVIGTGLD